MFKILLFKIILIIIFQLVSQYLVIACLVNFLSYKMHIANYIVKKKRKKNTNILYPFIFFLIYPVAILQTILFEAFKP